jgi:hypothetical protein
MIKNCGNDLALKYELIKRLKTFREYQLFFLLKISCLQFKFMLKIGIFTFIFSLSSILPRSYNRTNHETSVFSCQKNDPSNSSLFKFSTLKNSCHLTTRQFLSYINLDYPILICENFFFACH